ncbi:hypothetical protein J3459_007466 [Metarhizium acridum]|uniref:Uncharacterized protein n=1 Tax=Metarhizium acridum (strain CQMa 102) TaxID=655827 RepID=E9EB50_METAQ|nr:uncharacterized protein MAC_07098 [Metarhizium acridum CQMa 102]EFY86882.1 hypothetical protein MAC_07098 [Metarhizium acridum CQMa 102]KAG8427150.1 hypothetical protein J3459_007466 [Metarhizium acridum]
MATRLDLSQSSVHGKVMVAPPRINLRRTASYNDRSAGTISSTSSRMNFNHLLFSPPPSPSLPALVPRRKRSGSELLFKHRPSRIIRRFLYLSTLLAGFYLCVFAFRHRNVIHIALPYFSDPQYEMVGQDSFPDFPTPIVVHDSKKRSKWTVSIPRNYEFPLSIKEYSSMNALCREVSARARDLHHKMPLPDKILLSYDRPDDYFVDVSEAEKTGLLPAISKGQPPRHSGQFSGLSYESMSGKPVCDRSLTYVLESPDAGLGKAVMNLWTLYALAKEQGRAFFIDDSRWAYGTYTSIFQAPPVPDCRPPPRHEMLPCPAQTRHLVVSSVTMQDVLPALLAKHQRQSHSDLGTRDLFGLAHRGYKALFKLSEDDEVYVDNRIRDLKAKTRSNQQGIHVNSPIIGLHIRHGDRHPLEYQYRDTYIPAEVFASYGHSLIEAYYNSTSLEPEKYHAVRIIASDDPMVHEESEFADAYFAQEHIRLATKQVIQDSNKNPQFLHAFEEEAFGWEGGFFAAMFWNFGGKPKHSAADEDTTKAPSEEILRLRSLVGRAYMMDLAVLSRASDKVVCAVSAMGCRLLAVMMGWERAMDHRDWQNVDGGYGWGGLNLD